MGKRSEFDRIEKDFYATFDQRAGKALLPHIKHILTYSEPCIGKWHLYKQLELFHPAMKLVQFSDFEKDALTLTKEDLNGADAIITNPPWSRKILHQMIMHFKDLAPTWLLFDSDWMHAKQAIPMLPFCTDIVSIGRMKWFEGSKFDGKDNCAWYRFQSKPTKGIKFHQRING